VNEKCNYQTMKMCDRAKDSGIISFGQAISEGFRATIIGSGLIIDFCPYCGESLKEIEIRMINISEYGESPIVGWLKKQNLRAPIIPISAGKVDLDYKPNRNLFIDSYFANYKYSMEMAKFQEHINDLKSDRDKLPGYAQDSLDAIVNISIFGGTS